jgi:CheY-like chemotaxis protein
MDLKGKLILVVDNHEETRQIVPDLLRHFLGQQTEIYQADGTGAALWKLAEREYDLIIVNHRLPDGGCGVVIETAKKVNPDCRAILISSYEWDGELISKLGADAFLRKPIELGDLKKTVKSIML